MKNKMLMKKQSSQAIAVINNIIISEEEKLKLKTIAIKIYHSIKLIQEETSFWNSFPNSAKLYILTGDIHCSLDFTEYQKADYNFEV
jgi:ASC-1-like (ASCH) protein